jgi:hypothetical protein
MVDTPNKLGTGSDGSRTELPRKKTYEPPVLKHLGSVNRLTLSLSGVQAGDGIRSPGKNGG